ncbi:Zn-ribbon domain-containing OB-fold protein [Kurthia senegalensis]|uniref:Zn-ribbon domain-containing OB-fold protein n=1 Tax=Kurthia senegalensis TaxID=1033740 RepID=UPI0002882033|nr:Zn-ribbon domain-containing OB-fold protein [Kurthia senegalensis]
MTEETKVQYAKPIPLKTIDNAPYWDAADQHELNLQKCTDCGHYAHPPGPACAHCGSENVVWENQGSSIEGTVYSYVVSYRPFLPGFEEDLPLVIAVVELAHIPEVKIIANILNATPDQVDIGTSVKMVWEKINDERAIPQWELA